MKIFTIEYDPKYSDDLVLSDEKAASNSIDDIVKVANVISSNVTGRILVNVYESGNLLDTAYFPLNVRDNDLKKYLEGFTS